MPHVAGGVEGVDPLGEVVDRAAVGADAGVELGHGELARVGEFVEEALADLFGFFDDLGHVARVVAQRPVLAGVEAALDPEHDQDQDEQPGAERERAAQQNLLSFGTTGRPAPAAAGTGCGILHGMALQSWLVAGRV